MAIIEEDIAGTRTRLDSIERWWKVMRECQMPTKSSKVEEQRERHSWLVRRGNDKIRAMTGFTKWNGVESH